MRSCVRHPSVLSNQIKKRELKTFCGYYALFLGSLYIQNAFVPRTPLEQLTAIPHAPSWWGEACCPLPKNPFPTLILRPQILAQGLQSSRVPLGQIRELSEVLLKRKG